MWSLGWPWGHSNAESLLFEGPNGTRAACRFCGRKASSPEQTNWYAHYPGFPPCRAWPGQEDKAREARAPNNSNLTTSQHCPTVMSFYASSVAHPGFSIPAAGAEMVAAFSFEVEFNRALRNYPQEHIKQTCSLNPHESQARPGQKLNANLSHLYRTGLGWETRTFPWKYQTLDVHSLGAHLSNLYLLGLAWQIYASHMLMLKKKNHILWILAEVLGSVFMQTIPFNHMAREFGFGTLFLRRSSHCWAVLSINWVLGWG